MNGQARTDSHSLRRGGGEARRGGGCRRRGKQAKQEKSLLCLLFPSLPTFIVVIVPIRPQCVCGECDTISKPLNDTTISKQQIKLSMDRDTGTFPFPAITYYILRVLPKATWFKPTTTREEKIFLFLYRLISNKSSSYFSSRYKNNLIKYSKVPPKKKCAKNGALNDWKSSGIWTEECYASQHETLKGPQLKKS